MSTAREILAAAFEISSAEVPDNASIGNFQPWDSLGHLKVITEIETKLSRSLETEEVLAVIDLDSIKKLVDGNSRT